MFTLFKWNCTYVEFDAICFGVDEKKMREYVRDYMRMEINYWKKCTLKIILFLSKFLIRCKDWPTFLIICVSILELIWFTVGIQIGSES